MKIKNFVLAGMLTGALLLTTGCSEADKVNANISKQADYFESQRKITVYNARTDKVILECEGDVHLEQLEQRTRCDYKNWTELV